jgi:hypothetical protein
MTAHTGSSALRGPPIQRPKGKHMIGFQEGKSYNGCTSLAADSCVI